MTRRDFLKPASTATLSALAGGFSRPILAETEEKITPTADTLIILWMAGGMAHTETFDPKRYTPFAAGLEPKAVLSTFPSIPTAGDRGRFYAGLEQLAAAYDRGALIPTMQAGDIRGLLHSPHPFN